MTGRLRSIVYRAARLCCGRKSPDYLPWSRVPHGRQGLPASHCPSGASVRGRSLLPLCPTAPDTAWRGEGGGVQGPEHTLLPDHKAVGGGLSAAPVCGPQVPLLLMARLVCS